MIDATHVFQGSPGWTGVVPRSQEEKAAERIMVPQSLLLPQDMPARRVFGNGKGPHGGPFEIFVVSGVQSGAGGL
jgi:hypothetical protein